MNQQSARDIAVGLTTLVGIAGFIVLLVLFGYLPAMFQQGYTVTLRLPDGGGVHADSNVTLAGVKVGKVEDVQLAPVTEGGVVVTARIDEGVLLPAGTHAQVPMNFFGAGGVVDLIYDLDDLPQGMLPTDGTAVIPGRSPSPAAMVQEALAAPIERLDAMANDFGRLVTRWDRVGASLDAMLTPGGEADLPAAIAGAKEAAEATKLAMAQAESLLGDETMRDDLRATVQEARALTESTRKRLDTLGAQLETDLPSLSEDYRQLAKDFSQVLGQIQRVTERLEAGEGTAGRLLTDASAYENLEDATDRLNAVLDDARLLIEKWRKEGLPLRLR